MRENNYRFCLQFQPKWLLDYFKGFLYTVITNRKAEALQIANGMANIETCFERNIYWALEGSNRIDYLKERIFDDLRQLTWDIWAYSAHADITKDKKEALNNLREQIDKNVKKGISV